MNQLTLFNEPPKLANYRTGLITTVHHDQKQIVRWISQLYLQGAPFECDPTYSKGVIWRGLAEPTYKYDLNPQVDGVEQADATALPHSPGELASIFFDPPFLITTGAGSIIKDRFSSFPTLDAMWDMYRGSLAEFWRVLQPGGVLTFKCQDFVSSGKQVPSQFNVMSFARGQGFEWLDTLILVAKSVILVPHRRQVHARKTHSYFLVFRKPVSGKKGKQ